MTRIILNGIHGKMGKTLQYMIKERTDCEVVAGVDSFNNACDVPVFPTLAECNVSADVLIDFSNANCVDNLIDECVKQNLPCVVCTTGLSDETTAKLIAATKNIAIFKSANMSLGINVLIALAQKANTLLGKQYEIEIIEKHHHNKLDAPSGTALMIADEINNATKEKYNYVYDRHAERKKRSVDEIGLHAVRGGSIVGDHDVLFCGPDEVITISHSAASRDVFANGAVNAALFLAGKPAGLYTMKDIVSE